MRSLRVRRGARLAALVTSLLVVLLPTGIGASPAVSTGEGERSPRDGPPSVQLLQAALHTFGERRWDNGPPLTLDDALDEALARNPTLILLRRAFDAARLRPAQEQFLMPPTFEAQIWQWPIGVLNPVETNMFMFTVGQEIPGRGKQRARAAVREKEAEVAESGIAVRARAVIDEVKRAYADLSLARKEIEIHHANVDLLRQLAEISEARYATGRISQQDVVKAVVELSRLHDHLVVLAERAERAEARLNALLDRPPDAPIGAVRAPDERVILPSSADLQALALERQPELRAAALERERAEASLAAARAEYRPDVVIGGGYFLMPRERDSWTASVGITWPGAPWARGRLDARVAEARAEIAASAAAERVVENAIRLAVQDAYVRAQSAARRAALLRTSVVPQSEQALEVARAAYQTDRVDFLALIDNQRVLLDAQLSYYRALSDFEQAFAELERAVGTEITADMVATSERTER